MTPVIIEAAINGVTPKTRNPNSPREPEEIAEVALACIAAGARIIHNHIDDLSITGLPAASRYTAGWVDVLKTHPDAIICPTLTVATDPDEAVAHLAPCAQGGALMAPLDPGSENICDTGPDGLPGEKRFLYINSFELIDRSVRALGEAGLGPSVAIYEPGFLRMVLAYHRAGKLPKGTLLKFYFGGDYDLIASDPDAGRSGRRAVSFGLPPTRKALDAYLEMIEGTGLPWAIAVLGGDSCEGELAPYALERGGHLRVGLEDFAGPEQPDNVELVNRAVALAKAAGRPIATFAQAREMLDLRPVMLAA